jgi:hypothetical protein
VLKLFIQNFLTNITIIAASSYLILYRNSTLTYSSSSILALTDSSVPPVLLELGLDVDVLVSPFGKKDPKSSLATTPSLTDFLVLQCHYTAIPPNSLFFIVVLMMIIHFSSFFASQAFPFKSFAAPLVNLFIVPNEETARTI